MTGPQEWIKLFKRFAPGFGDNWCWFIKFSSEELMQDFFRFTSPQGDGGRVVYVSVDSGPSRPIAKFTDDDVESLARSFSDRGVAVSRLPDMHESAFGLASAPHKGVKMSWQSMESAPKDRPILLLGGVSCGTTCSVDLEDNEISHVSWDNEDSAWTVLNTDYYDVLIKNPLMWHPCPEPPKES